MRIVHFSDPHIGGPPSDWRAVFDKRFVGVFNYHYFRSRRHNNRWLGVLARRIEDDPPDMVVCTGDITTTGEPSEFRASLRPLLKLSKEKGTRILFVPGNHDIYVDDPKCRKAMADAFRLVNEQEGLKLEDLPTAFKFRGIDFCVVNECLTTSLFSSCGYMDAKTSDYILKWASGPKDTPRVLVGHYPVREVNPLTGARHRLWGQEAAARAISDGRIDLSLCGHSHAPFARVDDRGRGEVCAGSLTRHACAAEIVYEPATGLFKHAAINLRSENEREL